MERVKKILSVFLIAMTSMSWVGCGKSNDGGDNKPASTQGEGKQDKKKDEGKVNSYYVKDPLLPGTFAERWSEISFLLDAPNVFPKVSSNGQVSEVDGYYAKTGLYTKGNSEEFGVDVSKVKTPKDAFKQMEKQFLSNAPDPIVGNYKYEYTIVKDEERKVNEWDMYRA